MKKFVVFVGGLSLAVLAGGKVIAADQTAPDTRYGLFNSLDHRSSYGQDAFPEPFLVDDSAQEEAEFRLDWLHTASGSDHTDNAKAEIEYGIGLLTLELELPYERDVTGRRTAGWTRRLARRWNWAFPRVRT